MRLHSPRVSLSHRHSYPLSLPLPRYSDVHPRHCLCVHNDLDPDWRRLEKDHLHPVDLNRCTANIFSTCHAPGNTEDQCHHKTKDPQCDSKCEAHVSQTPSIAYAPFVGSQGGIRPNKPAPQPTALTYVIRRTIFNNITPFCQSEKQEAGHCPGVVKGVSSGAKWSAARQRRATMPATIPQQSPDLFQKKAFAHLATLMSDGRPQVTRVWATSRVCTGALMRPRDG